MKNFIVSSSPHYRSTENIRTIMLDVVLAMLPILAISVVYFGFRALSLCLVAVAASISAETLYNVIRKKKNTVTDFSCIVTGMLLSFNLPVSAPYWMAVVGSVFAIIVVKMLFGGLGHNFANPALAARAFLLSWPILMTTYIKPLAEKLPVFSDPFFTEAKVPYMDAISTATPLEALKAGKMPTESIMDMFFGKTGGCIGEVCAAAIILGGIYLLVRKIITWHIPVAYIGTVALITFIWPLTGGNFDYEFMLAQLFSGGLMLGAFFMATDYSTSPTTNKGMLIFGFGCGIITVLLRYFGSYNEGVSYAILFMNIFAFALDKGTKPRRYGIGGKKYDIEQKPQHQ